MVVEDDIDYARMLRVVLGRVRTDHSFEAHFCDRLADARVAVESKRADVVLADFNLPDGNGLELVGHAQLVAPDSHRIVLTGTPAEAHAATSDDARPHAIWDKRIGADELCARLGRVFAAAHRARSGLA